MGRQLLHGLDVFTICLEQSGEGVPRGRSNATRLFKEPAKGLRVAKSGCETGRCEWRLWTTQGGDTCSIVDAYPDLSGSHDVLAAAFAEPAPSLILRSGIVNLNAGHFIPLERPSELATSLADFFEEIVQRWFSHVKTIKSELAKLLQREPSALDCKPPMFACLLAPYRKSSILRQ